MEGCLREISQSPADSNVRLIYLEDEILRHADAGESETRQDGSIRRRGVVFCVSEEVADALLRWMKQSCSSLASLNPAKLNLAARTSHRCKYRHDRASIMAGFVYFGKSPP